MDAQSIIKFQKIVKRYLSRVSDDQIARLGKYEELLAEWNKKINLVSRKDEENIWSRHIVGSIAFLVQFDLTADSSIVDIGTGGGLPGIPLAILYPGSRITLIDSIQKKITAVDDMIKALELKNAKAYWGRAEELSRKKEFQGCYDYVVSRAVAPVRDIVKWCKPFLRASETNAIIESNGMRVVQKGTFLFLKGGDLTDEISYAEIKFKPREILNFELPLIEEIPELTDKRLIVFKP
jgi:16S rRNA (guanine527-N7)-methyltransferase